MRKSKQILTALVLTALVLSALCIPASAITESEVEAQVAASGREAVTGSVLLWFLCAVAFLKVSQKIDSFMATLGVNVGRTGGSMLAEAMIAMRTVTMVMGGGHGGGAGRTGSAAGSSAGRAGAAGMAGFFKGGLVGMASRHVTSSAVKSAVTNTSSFHTAQSQSTRYRQPPRPMSTARCIQTGIPPSMRRRPEMPLAARRGAFTIQSTARKPHTLYIPHRPASGRIPSALRQTQGHGPRWAGWCSPSPWPLAAALPTA